MVPFGLVPGSRVYSCFVPKSRRRKPKKAAGRAHRRGDPRLASGDALAAARFEDAKNRLAHMLAGGCRVSRWCR